MLSFALILRRRGKKKQKLDTYHKSICYIATVLALVTIGLGTRIAAGYENQFLAGFIACLVSVVVVAFIMVFDSIQYKKREQVETSDRAEAWKHGANFSLYFD
mmetsp:Transcript_24744/g.44745  ORF Transcript_24744/g.44745 Transcript_24744/m.44745 type:complete len:103 (-) Transcript_24744:154-462(-)